MSTFSTRVVTIDEILPFPDPPNTPEEKKTHSLELVRVGGWFIISSKATGNKVGDSRVYIEPETVLTDELVEICFSGTKLSRPSNNRIRAAKIRGVISPGLLLKLSDVGLYESTPVGSDVSKILGTKKYEEPVKEFKTSKNGTIIPTRVHADFARYTDIENLKNYHGVFAEGELVHQSLKIHGCSARFGWAKTSVGSFLPLFQKFNVKPGRTNLSLMEKVFGYRVKWFVKENLHLLKNKVKLKLGMLPPYEFCVGSRKCELLDASDRAFYSENVWHEVAKKYNLAEEIGDNEFIYGEIYGKMKSGAAIQKNFSYGLDGLRFAAYDVRINGEWLNVKDFEKYCCKRGIPTVPTLYEGPFSFEKTEELRNGKDHPLDKTVPCREGIVTKSCAGPRKVYKSISDAYYMSKSTDYN